MLLRGISSPVQGGDAANKEYVDNALSGKTISGAIRLRSGDVSATAYCGNGDFSIIPLYINAGSRTINFLVHIAETLKSPVPPGNVTNVTPTSVTYYNVYDGANVVLLSNGYLDVRNKGICLFTLYY